MRRTYGLWLLALGLKFAGASWDVSWHFRTIRESISPPHVVNGLGEVLFLSLLVHEWRHRTPERVPPLRIMLAGMLLWLVAVPFDELWHRLYGLDLTTWSPSHLLLFYGTGIAVTGLAWMFLVDLGWRPGVATFRIRDVRLRDKAVLAVFVLLAAEGFLFPLTYNEHTAVAVETARERPHELDPALLEMALTVPDPYFHGTPPWLYAVYCLGVAAVVALVARRALGAGWALLVLGGYAVVRFGVDALLGAGGWPQSVVPWQYVAIGLAWEAAWLLPLRAPTQAAVGAGLSTLAAYAYWERIQAVMLAVPVRVDSWAGGLLAALLGAALGWLLWDLAQSPRRQEPLLTTLRRGWAEGVAMVGRRR